MAIDLYGMDPWANTGSGDFGVSLDTSGWSQPVNFDSYSNSWNLPYTADYSFDTGYSFTPDYASGAQAPIFSTSDYGTGFQIPMSNLQLPESNAGGDSWYSKLGDWALSNPDKAVGGAMGLLGGLGSMMASRQSNKMAKQMYKRNKMLMDAERAAIARQQKIQAATDPYNYSVDSTTPATVSYTPLTAAQALSYGETGAPFQQVSVTPGVTTRTPLQGFANGGLSQYALGGASGGQDDKIPAMLSDGEYVFDADTVAALGDGNTNAGAKRLDEMRQAIRAHKRSAPVDRIPPKAKKPSAYLKKGKK